MVKIRNPWSPVMVVRALLGVAVLLFGMSFGVAQAGAQSSATDLAKTPNPFQYEPTAAEVVRKALEYFRASPEAFDRLRAAAEIRGLLPTVATGYRYYDLGSDSKETQSQFEPHQLNANRNDKYNSFTVGLIWDFRQVLFNPAEVQIYGLVGVQRDVMLEVTRTYFLRRQLVLRLALQPPTEALSRASLELRIDEFTAILDVLTGAWFSEESTRRRDRGRRADNGDSSGIPRINASLTAGPRR